MLSTFYQKYSKHLLWAVALSFPFLLIKSGSIPSNNDIETWLPKKSEVRDGYEEFKAQFGAEELILIGLNGYASDDPLVESLSTRIEQLPQVRSCWSPSRLESVMQELGVTDTEIDRRLRGLAISETSDMIGLVAMLSAEGVKHRADTVDAIREQLDYCQLTPSEYNLAGAPVIVAEMDRLGDKNKNQTFFRITLLISLCLLYYCVRQWDVTLGMLGLTVWAIMLTTTILYYAGGEMNFVLGALSVMVMVFTLSISVHVLHYYTTCMSNGSRHDPVGAALRMAWKPCFLATLTTTIGLISLAVSDIGPVRQFGYAASLGSIVALVTGLGLTPALLQVYPYRTTNKSQSTGWFQRWLAQLIVDHKRVVIVTALSIACVLCTGLWRLQTKIDALDFLPQDGKVITDVRRIQKHLTNIDSIEAVVDFGYRDIPFADKLDRVRKLETVIQSHPAVRHTMSAASFFPKEWPDSALAAANLLSTARSRQSDTDFLSEDRRLWRISARINPTVADSKQQVFNDLIAMTSDWPVEFTGIAPLIEGAQQEIFKGFWESFTSAFLIITLVMMIALRSVRIALIAMIPNLAPICIVFGALGWMQFPVDIGMMMCGSIALGIAVDGTFHFLVRYQDSCRAGADSETASKSAFVQSGAPIAEAAIIASLGMLGLTLSSFAPTARFGYLMAVLLLVALPGDLILLPALLSVRLWSPKKPQQPEAPTWEPRRPKFRGRTRVANSVVR